MNIIHIYNEIILNFESLKNLMNEFDVLINKGYSNYIYEQIFMINMEEKTIFFQFLQKMIILKF